MVTKRRGQAAFTLIELLVTLAILVILTTLAAPSFNSYIANQRVKSAAYDLMASLNYARSEAAKRNDSVRVKTTTGGAEWSEKWSVDFDWGTTLQTYTPNSSVDISEINGKTELEYRGNGRPTGSLQFEICDPDGSADVTKRIIEIDLTGRPNLKRGGACNV